MQLSIVIPLFNEQDSLTELTESIQSIILSQDLDYEIILIDDGSTWYKSLAIFLKAS